MTPTEARSRFLTGLLLLLFAIVTGGPSGAGPVRAEEIDYERDIKPLLLDSCAACHGALKQEAGLRLDTRRFALRGGDNGAIIVPGGSDQSLLLHRVSADGDERMPPPGKGAMLNAEKIALLRAWIDAGAAGPDNELAPADPRSHWAYQRPTKSTPSLVETRNPPRNPIDAFLNTKRVSLQLKPADETDRRTWIRRVSLALVGLPPTPAEVHAFLTDQTVDATDRVIERLLASPRYGERWGRHWMDVWRYSDWSGYQSEVRNSQRHIWRWRDWIIRSLNDDKPYDQMILEMLAGDELAPSDPDVLAATGFLARNWYLYNRSFWLDATVEHTSKAFLGMTMNCARCHDHKYDPIAQTNYYQMRAIFEPHNTRTDQIGDESDLTKDGLPRVYDAYLKRPTFLFANGSAKHPERDNPIEPGVPAALGGRLDVRPIDLPASTYYPFLRNNVVAAKEKAARMAVEAAQQELEATRKQYSVETRELPVSENTTRPSTVLKTPPEAINPPTSGRPFLVDVFETARDDLWSRKDGTWTYRGGRLIQTQVARQRSELVSTRNHPRDFVARLNCKIIGGDTYHSVGLSFDCRLPEESRQTVYLSAYQPDPKIQIAHTIDGMTTFPQSGKLPSQIERGREYRLEVWVRDRTINVAVDGKLQLAYETPHSRADGRFSVWTFDCVAEFDSIEVSALPDDARVQEAANFELLTEEDLQADSTDGELAVTLAELTLLQSQVAARSLTARIAADRVKYGELARKNSSRESRLNELSLKAGALQLELAELDARIALLKAVQGLREAERDAETPNQERNTDAIDKARVQLKTTKSALSQARAATQRSSNSYAPLGTEYPRTSSGRRLALAKWIVDRANPLTARVAVNHIWMRHFGSPLVEHAFDFGLRTPAPLHQDLLDWLAVEFMQHNWSMKHIHRLIVTSDAYAMSSKSVHHERNMQVDPANRYLWKMDVRRLEAEVVRDSILHVAGNLDTTMGGAELAQGDGQTTWRRSLYFRHAYEKKMRFLELFDGASETDCYRRAESITPQQALALSNSQLSRSQSRRLARELSAGVNDNADFVRVVFEHILGRHPREAEAATCREFLESQTRLLSDKDKLSTFNGGGASQVEPSGDPKMRSRENLVHVLLNHNDFVTVR